MLAREREDDTKSAKSAESVSRGVLHSRQSLLDLVSSKFMGRHTPTHHYYQQQVQQVRLFLGVKFSATLVYFASFRALIA